MSRGGVTDRAQGGQTDRVIESIAAVQISAIAAGPETATLATSSFLPARTARSRGGSQVARAPFDFGRLVGGGLRKVSPSISMT